MCKNTKQFISHWVRDTFPLLGEQLKRLKNFLREVYQEAREDYEKKKAENSQK